MNNLFDMIRNAQGGNGIQNLAQQFGLQPGQVQNALEALLPAFSMGLEKQAQDPAGMMNMFGKVAQGPFAQMFDQGADPAVATAAGNDVLGALFGSKDMSRAVAAQASAASGISSTIIKAMLPAIAAMVMGGVMKNMFNGQGGMLGGLISSMFGGGNAQQAQAGGGGLGDLLGQMMGNNAPQANAAGGGGLGDLLGQMMGGGQGQPAAAGGGGLGDLLGQMMGGGQGQPAAAGGGGLGDLLGQMMGGGQAQPAAAGGGGLGDLLGQMMGGGHGQPGTQAANPMDMFGDMFKSGAKTQQGQVDGLQSIFDQFLNKR